ncbi:4Fe-4S binding protein [Actinoplanes teichomyceticus]|uniref:4Fe-4S binding protein n=1 Tax=Actinoplanes teichomyceticus TaxID=1867 RepID=A0A561WBI3_ACTTI|nr:4Fe-4S binding protein [Actinoplanes teichomyceticus]TWG21228.1 4Fe-4S binding protein [Actinoplanes teichomyceticus]GIF17070.1 ferredoxin [Actinoplanes teichomyceticus]
MSLDTPPRPARPQPDPPRPRNLLDRPLVARALRSRWYPGLFQWIAVAVFALVVWQLLAGPQTAHDNFGTALVWVLWWPLIPIVFVAVGRFWCAVCPFGKLSDVVQRLVGAQRPVPRFLKRYGIWLIDAQFILITWSDHIWGIVESPWGTGVLLLLLITAVVGSGAFFQRRTFCRYLCFLGGMSGNYAQVGALELRANTDICRTCTARAVCFNGGDKAPACPLFEFPRAMESSANCNLCANCVKNCPNDAIRITPRAPSRELWSVRDPKIEASFLAMAIMGIVLIQNLTMLRVWQDVLGWIDRTTGITSYPVVFTLAFVVAVGAPVTALWAASAVAARRNAESVAANFARFGYALIPLDVAGHIAHNLFHLLAEGGSVVHTAVAAFGGPRSGGSAALLGAGAIQVLQYAVLALGIAGSAYAVHRIARARWGAGPAARGTATAFLTVVVVFAAANLALFALPMAMRM